MYCIACKMEVRVQDMGEKEKRTKQQAGDAEGDGRIRGHYMVLLCMD